MRVGPAARDGTAVGPVVSEPQFEKVQGLIKKALRGRSDARRRRSGPPERIEAGYFVQPTVLAGVTNDMTIAREEIFGPVLTLITYRDEDEAVGLPTTPITGLPGW